MPNLRSLKLDYMKLSDEFYSTMASEASKSKVYPNTILNGNDCVDELGQIDFYHLIVKENYQYKLSILTLKFVRNMRVLLFLYYDWVRLSITQLCSYVAFSIFSCPLVSFFKSHFSLSYLCFSTLPLSLSLSLSPPSLPLSLSLSLSISQARWLTLSRPLSMFFLVDYFLLFIAY